MVRAFREGDGDTPIVLMGYYNPIYSYGNERFLAEAKAAGVDGLIVVDLPPEADDELCMPAMKRGLNFIRLATPTTDDKRLPAVLANTSGFVYYVSILGITGTASPDAAQVGEAVTRIKRHTILPVAVGFGVKTAAQAARHRPRRRRRRGRLGAGRRGRRIARWRRPGDGRDGRGRDRPRRRTRRRRPRGAGRGGRVAKDFVVSWISNVVRPKIRNFLAKREVPQNLWIKCPETGEMVFHRDLEANHFVIPGSGYHMRMTAKQRFEHFFDGGEWETIPFPDVPARSAEIPRRAPLHRPPPRRPRQDRRGRCGAWSAPARSRTCRWSPPSRISTSWAARSAWPPARRSSPA